MTALLIAVAWSCTSVAVALVAGPVVTKRPASPQLGVWLIAAALTVFAAVVSITSSGRPVPTSPVTPATAAPAVPFQP